MADMRDRVVNDFKVERKFVVLNLKDINRYLDENDQRLLSHICNKVCDGRMKDGKTTNSYIVCNEDESYSDKIWSTIIEGEAKKHKSDFRGNSQ